MIPAISSVVCLQWCQLKKSIVSFIISLSSSLSSIIVLFTELVEHDSEVSASLPYLISTQSSEIQSTNSIYTSCTDYVTNFHYRHWALLPTFKSSDCVKLAEYIETIVAWIFYIRLQKVWSFCSAPDHLSSISSYHGILAFQSHAFEHAIQPWKKVAPFYQQSFRAPTLIFRDLRPCRLFSRETTTSDYHFEQA